MLIAGIDEAGYGPILGPMLVSGVAFRLPESLSGVSLWDLLSVSVTAKPRKMATKLVITDSKKVYARRSGLRNLERSALAAVWACTRDRPVDFTSLLAAIALDGDPHLQHRWYCHSDLPLPYAADRDELGIARRLFINELAEANAELVLVMAVPMVESRFNQLIDQMHKKSAVLFGQTVRLVDAIIRATAEKRIDIYLDKQGGKMRYVNDLMRTFGQSAELEVLDERPEYSGYRLGFRGKTVTLHFLMGAETQHLPVALASIVSKYVRELFMLQFNDYWCHLYPGLRPTAGYFTDGKRFLADLAGRGAA